MYDRIHGIIYAAGLAAVLYLVERRGYDKANKEFAKKLIEYGEEHWNETFGEFLIKGQEEI